MSDKVAHRYDIACSEDCRGPGLERAKDGDWVAFEDYEVLQKKLESWKQEYYFLVDTSQSYKRRIEELEAEVDELNGRIGNMT